MGTPKNDPEKADADTDESKPRIRPDSQSDPALDDGDSSDWSSEGGAVTGGPATDTDNS